MRENAKDLGLDQDARARLPGMVPTHHAGAAGAGLLDRALCGRAGLHLSCGFRCAARASGRPAAVGARSASPAGAAHLAGVLLGTSSAGLVVVATLPSRAGQLLPHETSSEGRLRRPAHRVRLSACCSPARLARPARNIPGSAGVPGNRLRMSAHPLFARKEYCA